MATELTPADAPPPEVPYLKPGTMLGHFEIVERLGAGGFGVVYRARDTRLGRTVAVKLLPENFARDAERRERFRLEATAASALNHPNICTIHDFAEDAGRHFIVMELIEGQTLRELLGAGPLPASKAIDVGIQVASALAEAHAAGILHRDIKSTNIAVTPKGQAKILDFGIAKRVSPQRGPETTEDAASAAVGLTATGTTLGTLTYMSPEQLLGKPIDGRSDLFSLGVVLYEMVTGRLPFAGSTPVAVADAVLHQPPRDFGGQSASVPEELKSLIRRLLEKDPENRPPDAEAVREELARLLPGRAASPADLLRRPSTVAAIVILLLVLAGGGAWLWRRNSRIRWVQRTAMPEITRLVAAEKFPEAGALILEARRIEPKDPTLEKLWIQSTLGVSVESEPPGAEVSYRPYRGDSNAWTSFGRTPLENQRVPKDYYMWRVQKDGFAPAFEIEPTWTLVHSFPYKIECRLAPAASVPAGMTRVAGGKFQPFIPGLALAQASLDDFFIDRHEVTNEEFKKFVDAGGYQKRELWKETFTRDGKTIPFEEAIAAFRDTTGRPGPATWETGTFRKGFEKHPVAGVSWYEAAAYAVFAGKSLPTVFHWNRAAQTEASLMISPVSNFQGEDTLAVGDARWSGFGTTDMAGNVKEWCSNGMASGKRFILGGGFGEPTYMFIDQDAQSPWSRRPNFGFRCVQLSAPPAAQTTAQIEENFRDFAKEMPASDELFRAYKGSYAYDKTDLNARVEETLTFDDWKREKVTLDAAYGGERLIVYLFIPLRGTPPYHAVVYFPGSGAIQQDDFNLSPYADFIPRSGRVLVAPIYKSTFARRDAFRDDNPTATAFYRDHLIMWSKDVGRSLDYLDQRPDIRHDRYGYLGLSWGSQVAPVMLAVENRIKVAILESGGLSFAKALPDAEELNFLPRVKSPTLMINGRYDHFFPVETSQKPFLKMLGAPEADKKYVLFESGHATPRKELIRESLDWLDKYLGPVKP